MRTRLDDEHRQISAGDAHALEHLVALDLLGIPSETLKPGDTGSPAGSPEPGTAARAAEAVSVTDRALPIVVQSTCKVTCYFT